MSIKVHMLTLGIAQTNCYIIGDEARKEAIVVDPSDSAPTILDVINREGWVVREILATHSHFDHILAAGDLKAATGAPFRLHRADLAQLQALPQMMQMFTGQSVPPAPPPDGFVDEGDVIQVGAIRLDVRFTPGHSAGHVSYVCDDEAVVFSGDCVFQGSIGRTDLAGGDFEMLMRSIFDKLLSLPDDYTLAVGHGQTTTVGRERMSNPFILDWMDYSQV